MHVMGSMGIICMLWVDLSIIHTRSIGTIRTQQIQILDQNEAGGEAMCVLKQSTQTCLRFS